LLGSPLFLRPLLDLLVLVQVQLLQLLEVFVVFGIDELAILVLNELVVIQILLAG